MKNRQFDFVLRAQLVQLCYDLGEQEHLLASLLTGHWNIDNS